jgi:positive regulator of sigma E activity
MKLLTDLFSTDYGLMSISGIVFMLGMAVFFVRLFKRKMREDAAKAGV